MKHKDSLSNTTLRQRRGGRKYNLVGRTKSIEDISKDYEIRKDGWRKKKTIAKVEREK